MPTRTCTHAGLHPRSRPRVTAQWGARPGVQNFTFISAFDYYSDVTDTLPVEKCDSASHQGPNRLREGSGLPRVTQRTADVRIAPLAGAGREEGRAYRPGRQPHKPRCGHSNRPPHPAGWGCARKGREGTAGQ